MNLFFEVNGNIDVPIYRQLADYVRTAIKKGEIKEGEKLPTVQELTEELGIARGTVKRAYDELERANFIEMVQGRGTFVCYKQTDKSSRKELAMAAIDKMLKELDEMGFSPMEINIFLNLKLREHAEEDASVKVAVVECNPENLSQMCEQLRHIDGVELFSFTVDKIKQYPYNIDEEFDLIVTTAFHYEYLESVVPNKKKIARVALRPSVKTISRIVKLTKEGKTGVVGYSKRFAELIMTTCSNYAEDVEINDFITVEDDVSHYIKDKDVIIVPEMYEKYFSAQQIEKIMKFKGEIIECGYELDEGSVLYLETKVKKIRENKIVS